MKCREGLQSQVVDHQRLNEGNAKNSRQLEPGKGGTGLISEIRRAPVDEATIGPTRGPRNSGSKYQWCALFSLYVSLGY